MGKWGLLVVLACNQVVYDEIYKLIIVQALQDTRDREVVFKERNEDIEKLRMLCRGQRSTYETGKRIRRQRSSSHVLASQ